MNPNATQLNPAPVVQYALHCLALCIATGLVAAALLIVFSNTSNASTAQPADQRLLLTDSQQRVRLWSHVTRLDETSPLTVEQVQLQKQSFNRPTTATETIGFTAPIVWLHIPLQIDPKSDGEWVIDFDYALLNKIDVYVIDLSSLKNAVGAHLANRELHLGNSQPFAQRPIPGRSHAGELNFKPGGSYDVYIRIESMGAKILPMTLSKVGAFHIAASNEQMLQGIFASLAACLLLYSLFQWMSLKERIYLKYGLLVLSSSLFSINFFGIGEQYLWTDNVWMRAHMAGITSLCSSGATALFVDDIFGKEMPRWMRTTLLALAGVLFGGALLHAMDVINIRLVGAMMTTIGLLPSFFGIPGTIKRIRAGDITGWYLLVAWKGYFIASYVMVGVVRGTIGVTPWTLHSFQLGAMLDMLIFLRIAVMRSATVYLQAQRAAMERDYLLTLATTDPLTGLMNRRGLHESIDQAIQSQTADKVLAVFVMDLDQFKPVNDRFGHDVGDMLLKQVAQRMQANMRPNHTLARLGGDEFVVLAPDMLNEEAVSQYAQSFIGVLSEPFQVDQHECRIGVTVGYALAPSDSAEAIGLIKTADAAMYVGKQRGKNCVHRIGKPTIKADATSPNFAAATRF